jgi:hypothetical protein
MALEMQLYQPINFSVDQWQGRASARQFKRYLYKHPLLHVEIDGIELNLIIDIHVERRSEMILPTSIYSMNLKGKERRSIHRYNERQ